MKHYEQAQANNPTQAKAQEPRRATEKIKYGKKLKIATLNVRGLKKPGKREEVEQWMKRNEAMIACLQEM